MTVEHPEGTACAGTLPVVSARVGVVTFPGSLDDDCCVIEVIDAGRGFDADQLGHAEADPGAEEGRGILLIRTLVDRVNFRSRPERGMVVHLEKRLRLSEGSPLQRLVDRGEATAELDLRKIEETIAERQIALAELTHD